MKSKIKIPKDRLTAPVDFGAVISEGSAYGVRLDYAEYSFMKSATGDYVLFDAYSVSHRYVPFDVKSTARAYPFCLTCETEDGERVAYCGLRFGDELPSDWKPCFAGSLSEIYAKLAVDPDGGAVPVPSGVCCIAPAEAYGKYIEKIRGDAHPLSGYIVLNGQTHTTVDIDGARYAVFSTGWGDGRYKCYAGYDGSGKVAAILIDFGMIEYPSSQSDETVEVETDIEYVYDPKKSETDNRIAQWTRIIENVDRPQGAS